MKVAVSNPGKSPMYVNGVMIAGGETRHFDETELPPALRPHGAPAAAAATADPVDELLAKPVAEILQAAATMTREEINALGEREDAKGPDARSELLAGLSREILRCIEDDDQEADRRRAADAAARAEAEAAEIAQAHARMAAEADAAALVEVQAKIAAAAAISSRPEKEVLAAIAGADFELVERLAELELGRAKARNKVLDALDARRSAVADAG